MALRNQRNYDGLDLLGFVSGIVSLLNYQENLKQTDNDEILEELQHQNDDYLEEIIRLLKEIKNDTQSSRSN